MDSIAGQLIKAFLKLDIIIYNAIGYFYKLLLELADADLFTDGMISSFTSRIYVLLGIFMLFKLSFSIITYIINPDEFLDKTKGITSIGKNVIISLTLMVLTPYIFYEAKVVQGYILKEHTLENLVFGDVSTSVEIMNDSSNTIKFQLFSQFVKPNTEIVNLNGCDKIYSLNTDGGYARDTDSSYSFVLNSGCWDYLEHEFNNSKYESGYNDYYNGMKYQRFAFLTREDIYLATAPVSGDDKSEVNIVDYSFFLSTVCGIVVLLLFITFCFDVAVRTIKLGFLQIIAPIPIVSYCDPKGKDGMFKKWTNVCVKTYLSLFIRLISVYFAINIITQLLESPYWDKPGLGVAKAFFVIGGLIFAKQLPGIISEISGVKLDSKMYLNPFKKVGEEALGGKQLVAGTALGAGMAIGGLTNAGTRLGKFLQGDLKGGISSGGFIRGALDAGRKGIGGALKGDGMGKVFSSSYKGAVNARKQRNDRADELGLFSGFETARGNLAHALGFSTAGDRAEYAKKKNDDIQSTYKSMMNSAVGNDKDEFTLADKLDSYYLTEKDRAIARRLEEKGLSGIKFGGIKGLQSYIDEVAKTSIDKKSFLTLPDKETYVEKRLGNRDAFIDRHVGSRESFIDSRVKSVVKREDYPNDVAYQAAYDDELRKNGSIYEQDYLSAVSHASATYDTERSNIEASYESERQIDEANAAKKYAEAESEHNQLLRDLEDLRDRRLNSIAAGNETATTDDRKETFKAIQSGYAKMKQLAGEINGINEEFGISKFDTTKDAKTINGVSKGVGNAYSASEKVEHATRVNKYIKTDKK